MSSMKQGPSGRTYWRSLDELAETPEFKTFLHREFPAGASELMEEDRRHFMKVMGASMALAGLGMTGCRRWPEEHILPYSERPEGTMPGVPDFYATIMEVEGIATGQLVTSYNGRPTKIDGNPDHSGSGGASSRYGQATILDLYDPDRSRDPRNGFGEKRLRTTWKKWDKWSGEHFEALRTNRGEGFWILSEGTSSPSIRMQQARLREQFPEATWVTWDPLADTNSLAGLESAFGGRFRPQYKIDNAKFMLSLDCDFLGMHPDMLVMACDWAAGRQPDHGSISRLIVVEPGLTATGSSADDRFGMRSADIVVLAARIAAKMTGNAALAAPFENSGVETPFLDVLVENIEAHPGESVVLPGPSQPPIVHHLAALINEASGSAGRTVSYTRLPSDVMQTASIEALASAMHDGTVDTLLMLGGNPSYNMPADLGFREALGKVAHSIHLSYEDNETSQQSEWHLNRAHALECWGDGRAWDGTYGICQPLILPLFDGRSPLEILAQVTASDTTAGFELVRQTFNTLKPEAGASLGFDPEWRATLHSGALKDSASVKEAPKVRRAGLDSMVTDAANALPGHDGVMLEFRGSYSVYDGRWANNGWLQELPDPMTRLTWDNAVIIGPSTADTLGVATGDMITITVGGVSIEAAALVQTGQAPMTASLAVGYGRRFAGRVCSGAGFDVYPLRTTDALWSRGGAAIVPTGETYPLATVQDHFAIDSVGGQGIAERLPVLFREASIETYNENPNFVKNQEHAAHGLSLWESQQFDGAQYRWGMAIDLNSCTGCGACVIACQAENNIPVVGKDQVLRGREMHWLRCDRYFRFKETSPGEYDVDQPASVAFQPVSCQQCENAPCEQVCPVAATVHSMDGLNVMVYNRCVGTRYCSNNCPYKVRRFNYFDYFRREPLRSTGFLQVQPDYYVRRQSGGDPLRRMQFNPEVTVRMRGVMEKCNFCTSRIQAAKIKAKNAWVKLPEAAKAKAKRIVIPDGSINSACAQACTNDCIVFGDLMDPEAKVSKMHANSRSYELLGELHIKPRNRYLARLNNPIEGERFPEDHEGHGHGHGDHGHDGHDGHDDHGHGHYGGHAKVELRVMGGRLA